MVIVPHVYCDKGHLRTPENTYIAPKSGIVNCRICNKARKKYRDDQERFGGLRETIIQRDNEKCVKCGMTRQEHIVRYGKDITVDHIDGLGLYSKVKNNDPRNLQTLCLPCHGRKDNRRRWEKD